MSSAANGNDLIATLSANQYVQVALTDGSSGDSIPHPLHRPPGPLKPEA